MLRTKRGSVRMYLLASALLLPPQAWAGAACSRSTGRDGAARFEIRGGEVLDRSTGLVWQRCSLGLVWRKGEGCTGERTGYFFDEIPSAVAAAGRHWRLPTANELGNLVDRDCGQPAIDRNVFPDVTASSAEAAERYWTATPGGVGEMMVFIDFADGYGDIHSRGFHLYVRLVRSGR